MDQNNDINKDMTLETIKAEFDTLISPIFSKHHRELCYLGLIFRHGKRKMLQINVPARDLPSLLQAKPSTNNDPESGKNRPQIKGHAQEIKDYVIERAKANKPWVLGTITANVNEEEIQIYKLGDRGLCVVAIPSEVRLDITDGQHRKSAIQDIVFSNEMHFIKDDNFAITLILEGNQRQCQKDFRDMAQTKQLDQSLLLSFGEFEGRVGITKNVIEQVKMFNGKTEKIKKNPSSQHKLIYTTYYLGKFVSCVFANDPKDELQGYDVDILSASLIDCLNIFFSECKDTKYIAENEVEKLTVSQVNMFKENSLLGVSVGIEVLGRLLNCIYDPENNYFDRERILQLAQIDWSRKNSLWENNIVRKVTNNNTVSYEINNRNTPIKDAVRLVKESLGWI